jgi:hypothetical protein
MYNDIKNIPPATLAIMAYMFAERGAYQSSLAQTLLEQIRMFNTGDCSTSDLWMIKSQAEKIFEENAKWVDYDGYDGWALAAIYAIDAVVLNKTYTASIVAMLMELVYRISDNPQVEREFHRNCITNHMNFTDIA